ncbi:MAG: hypothetical protein ACP5JR_04295 [Thermoplasmata archaeon]
MEKKPVIILDANMLYIPFNYSVNLDNLIFDFAGEIEIVVPSSVMLELEGLAKEDAKAKTVLKFATRYRIVDVSQKGDRGIIECAGKFSDREVYIATLDKKLGRIARKFCYKVVTLREGQKLALMER